MNSETSLLVVGGGPAGLAAAIAAAEAGAGAVLLDERAATGGQYAKPLADSHEDAVPDRQFQLGRDLAARARTAGVAVENDAIGDHDNLVEYLAVVGTVQRREAMGSPSDRVRLA